MSRLSGTAATARDTSADPAEHYRVKGTLRLIDSITVPWQGGVPPERCFNLGYFDARLAQIQAIADRNISTYGLLDLEGARG